MNGPTICRLPCGSARRTEKPSPRSRTRGTITTSSASQDRLSPSTGSLSGIQLMAVSRLDVRRRRGGRSSLDEGEQVRVDLILQRRAHAVGRARIDLQLRVLDDLGRKHGGRADRHDLVVIAVKDQGRDVELLEIFGQIRLGEGLDAEVGGGEAGQHSLEPERLAHAFRDLGARPVVAVERHAQILPELRAVGLDGGAELVERVDGKAARVGGRLEHERRYRADQHRLGHALGAVAADVTRDLAAARGMADVDRILQVERFDERREIVGVGVEVVAVPGLAGAAMAAAIMGDAAVSAGGEKVHLVFESIRRQRPAVAEDDGRSLAPIVVIDLRAILGLERRHSDSPVAAHERRGFPCLRSGASEACGYASAPAWGRNAFNAMPPSTTKIASTTACAMRNGGSDCVGARDLTVGSFWNACTTATKTLR